MSRRNKKIKLVAFDLDGVLVDSKGSWREVHEALGTVRKAEPHERLFYDGKISFDEWADLDTRLWAGTPIGRIKEILYEIRPMRGITYTLSRLRKEYKLVIISGGLQILADKIKDDHKMHHAVGNEILTNKGKVCGIKKVVGFGDKDKFLKKFAEEEGITTDECAAVGDYLNDIPMFKEAGLAIAFNPKHADIVDHVDEIVYGKNLIKILEFL
jgi:phosphoserine phosphatase